MMVKTFQGIDEHDEFQNWRQRNSEGFFLNVTTGKLHRVCCPNFETVEQGKEVSGSWTTYEKACSVDKAELVAWAQTQKIALSPPCKNCEP